MMKKIDKTKNRTYSSFVDLVYTQQKSLFLKPPQTAKTAISPEPLGRHRFKTPQIEALGLGNLKTTSGGL